MQKSVGEYEKLDFEKIDQKLKEKGIISSSEELIEDFDSVIPESRNPKKFIDEINS